MSPQAGRFLTAEWRCLLMLNFEISAEMLHPLVPRGTELDTWNDRALVSVVGFRFLHTKLIGIPIPFHRDFDEVNLRFYVRRKVGRGGNDVVPTLRGGTFSRSVPSRSAGTTFDLWRRGVVFIKEIVPRWMVSCVARTVYNENYVTRRMRHKLFPPTPEAPGRVEYQWKNDGRWNRMAATISGEPTLADPDSEEAFIAEHYWGYTRQRDGGAAEYEVQHPPWRVWQAENIEFDCDAKAQYGAEFAVALSRKPTSAFVAEGSRIVVRRGVRIASPRICPGISRHNRGLTDLSRPVRIE